MKAIKVKARTFIAGAMVIAAVAAIPLTYASAAGASDLLSVQGGLGYGLQGIGPGITDFEFLGSSWTFAQGYSNVAYTLVPNALWVAAGTTNTYYLTNAVGPSTTDANVLWSGSATFTTSGWISSTPVFSGVALDAGTYYLIIDPSAEETWQPACSAGGETVTSAAGVQFDGTIAPAYGGNDNAFPPDSSWWMAGYSSPVGSGPTGFELAFTLTSVPEPMSFGLLLLAGAGLMMRRRSVRR